MKVLFGALAVFILTLCLSCQDQAHPAPSNALLSSMGDKFRQAYHQDAAELMARSTRNPDGRDLLDYAQIQVLLYIFGLESRERTIPAAKEALANAWQQDSTSNPSLTTKAILHFLDWEWEPARVRFLQAIQADPNDANARHWYCLWLVSMRGDHAVAMAQSDTIMELEPSGTYQVGRGSLLYFARKNEALKALMKKTIDADPNEPWPYDWLGMAHCELQEFDQSIAIYEKAFELSDGLVEVGGGLGHALGLAGKHAPAKEMANYYHEAAKSQYLPQVQRAFIHIGLGEHDEAIRLLEEAYVEKSWFIMFLQIEPWYDPIRKDPRFLDLVQRMQFPKQLPQIVGG